ncbi:MAG TPA: hypothetical protein VFI65_23580 [Streptosporangiaceae bacterium]|nr:hypothetical protein [Streptosporangiaceae bacterium]
MFASLSQSRVARAWRSFLFLTIAALAGAIALPLPALGAVAAPSVSYTKLTLVNGWVGAPFGTGSPAVADIAGIVHFKGAISTSSTNANEVAFVLPPAFRPSKYVNVPVDLCDSARGELNIAPTGVTEVISSGKMSDATCFTSLDGVSFSLSTASFTTLKLQPGWTEFGTLFRKGAVRAFGGLVYLAGEIRPTSNKAHAFTLPAGFRPDKDVNVLINVCTGSIGRLHITPKGVVTVRSDQGFWAVKCGTSLDGASFALSPKSFKALKLQNGWVNAPSGTAKAAVRTISGIVHFMGAIKTSGTNAVPFTLPVGFRPAHNVYVPVDLCDGSTGRLSIQPTGVVAVQALSSFSQAQCLTSLDGASFTP